MRRNLGRILAVKTYQPYLLRCENMPKHFQRLRIIDIFQGGELALGSPVVVFKKLLNQLEHYYCFVFSSLRVFSASGRNLLSGYLSRTIERYATASSRNLSGAKRFISFSDFGSIFCLPLPSAR